MLDFLRTRFLARTAIALTVVTGLAFAAPAVAQTPGDPTPPVRVDDDDDDDGFDNWGLLGLLGLIGLAGLKRRDDDHVRTVHTTNPDRV